ncbi:MAG: hypothetical protein F6J94_20585 [Moorea sp. SIO1F2]|uniref:hypothetical protein n=1 Tax=Moorena sp. SIO1F2 TaxID=2607819 RepID=UPI0013B8567F|nr:hypothetical protein [Moorena sp. SIO1F2]NET84222.1 hypothetical protein [Moorena sp. SIO1F2]
MPFLPIPILTTEIQKLYSVFHNYLPTSDFPLTCSLLPAPCSLLPKTQEFVPDRIENRYKLTS